ncbi:MAG: enoyl-CoA hydratase/isomerase family protein [Thermodesulfobacteriota bacterium]|nr:enoyl-CoA hydratase/isomerase family protein [Thermodesulfobacteriota bacterium]
MKYNTILITKEEGYAILTLNRPDEMNALSSKMRRELLHCFSRLDKDDSVKAVILTGGDNVFSAGIDLNEVSILECDEFENYMRIMVKNLQEIYTFRKPVVAAVSGIALGGGFNLVTVCDMVIASETAIFGHPELKLGLNPLFDPLRRIVGTAKAKEITMLGEPIGAREALRIGLVNKVSPPERFMEHAMSVAGEISLRPARAVEAVKRISDIVPRLDKATALEYEFEITALLFSRAEIKEHIKLLFDKLKSRKKV